MSDVWCVATMLPALCDWSRAAQTRSTPSGRLGGPLQDWQSGWGANVCSRWLQRALVADWLERQWHGPLTITPCDLWQFLGPTATSPGRTLWIIGDSQASVDDESRSTQGDEQGQVAALQYQN